jgi:predicted branched-subunit amino acid permease
MQGVRDTAAVAPGLAAWGLMTGVAMIKSGMSLVEALTMTLLVFAGSSQLAAIPLIAGGAPLWVIWATAFCVNLRFVVFSAHLREYLMHWSRPWRLFQGYLTADLSYVIFMRRYAQPPRNPAEQQAQSAYLMGGCLLNWGSWQLSNILGILLAHAVPTSWGLGFAGILALLGVSCSMISSPLRAVSGVVAAAAGVAAFALPFKLNILVAIAAAVAVCMLLEQNTALGRKETA